MAEPEHFLVVRNDRLGDAILALPVVSALKRRYPGAKISFLASPYTAPLIRTVVGIEKVYEADDRQTRSIVKDLAGCHITTAICLRPTFPNAVALFEAKIPRRLGTAYRAYSLLFTDRAHIHRRGQQLHETDLNLALLSRLDAAIFAGFPEFNLPVSATSEALGLIQASSNIEKEPLIILHPGSSGSAKEWPLEHWIMLANLLKNAGVLVVTTGSLREFDACSRVVSDPKRNLAGKTNLLSLTALLRRASLFIAASTGPLHVANALGRPVIGLYPPVADNLPSRWGPYGHPERALTPDLPLCSRCKTGEHSRCWCMEQLSVDKVFELALKLIADR